MTWDPTNSRTPYEVLGVDRTVTVKEVRAAYRKLSRVRHPDRGGTNEAFQELNTASALLGDPVARSDYDTAFDRHYAAAHAAPPRPGSPPVEPNTEYQWNTVVPKSPFPATDVATAAKKEDVVEESIIYVAGFFAAAMLGPILAQTIGLEVLPIIPFVAYAIGVFLVHKRYASRRKYGKATGTRRDVKRVSHDYLNTGKRIAHRIRKWL